MKKFRKSFILVLVLISVFFCSEVFAGMNDRESRLVLEQAQQKNITLISVTQAQEIVKKRLNATEVFFKDIDLENEFKDYPNGTDFRPVYQIECVNANREYDFDIDAVTGEILKFKLDD